MPTGPTEAGVGASSHGLSKVMTHPSPPTNSPQLSVPSKGRPTKPTCASCPQAGPLLTPGWTPATWGFPRAYSANANSTGRNDRWHLD